MMSQPTPDHAWLQQFVGEWTYDVTAEPKPGEPAEKFTGTESIRAIGGLWIQCEGKGTSPDGTPATMMLTLGYDPKKGKYVGTWFGSMMDYLWVYEGTREGNVLTLRTTGPNFGPEGGTANYREVIEWKGPAERTFTSYMEQADGTSKQLMSMTYRKA